MANKNTFKSARRGVAPKVVNTVNRAGGVAYSRSKESDLAQMIVTGTSNGTFYANADEQVDTILALAQECSTEFLAKLAVYAHRVARMKDTPALLLAVLTNRGEEGLRLAEQIFGRVISNQKMLRNFAQIIRSGRCGRKSFGTAVKRMIQTWLARQDADQLFYQSVGNDPSLADIVKMVHPRPNGKVQEAFYGWLLGKEYNKRYLPKLLKEFEAYKGGDRSEVPPVDFRMLTALELDSNAWTQIALNASWNTIRMNLNTFQRHGVLNDRKVVKTLAEKLSNELSVAKANAFPYQLLTTYQATEGVIPTELSIAIQQALEAATQNVPSFGDDVIVCVDTSGSMQSAPVTGTRQGATTKTMAVDVAGLIASCVLRKNPNALVVPFDTQVHMVHLNPLDTVLTNARKLRIGGGGTDCASALRYVNQLGRKAKLVMYVSDNESWYGEQRWNNYYGCISSWNGSRVTGLTQEWNTFKARNPQAKLVCIDLVPNQTVQATDNKDVLNVGGFTDSVFQVVANFVEGDSRDFARVINDSVSPSNDE
jgi:60 kDa SS-A/Ro ribonucleoprotein